jgi:hypothetical protein
MLILPLPGVLSLCDQSTDACVSPDHTCVGPVALSPPSPSQLSLSPIFVLFLLARISDPATKRGATAGPPPAELEVVAVFVLRGVVGWARSSGKVQGGCEAFPAATSPGEKHTATSSGDPGWGIVGSCINVGTPRWASFIPTAAATASFPWGVVAR